MAPERNKRRKKKQNQCEHKNSNRNKTTIKLNKTKYMCRTTQGYEMVVQLSIT